MLFKEKLYLSNCDSVRCLDDDEVRKRLLIGVVFADGVVLSPNLLVDNAGMGRVLRADNLSRYFREEGAGKLVLRGFGVSPGCSLVEYFDALPGGFRVSRFGGRLKSSLSLAEADEIRRDLDAIQHFLNEIDAVLESVSLGSDALSTAILERCASGLLAEYFDGDQHALSAFTASVQGLSSRSAWYDHLEAMPDWSEGKKLAFRMEAVDAAYNALFVAPGEAFAMDRVRVLEHLPDKLLDHGVSLRAMRRKLELLAYPFRVFNLVSSLAVNDLAKVLMDEAMDYAESRLTNKGMSWATRKNWFGLYPHLTRQIGIELKS